jgi:hypothetical protein
VVPKAPDDLAICGVVRIDSSISSASIRSSSPELLSDDSDPSMFTLPKELDTGMRSGFAIVDQRLPFPLGESLLPERCDPLLRYGMFIALPDMVGEVSGEGCSASVE